MKFKLTAAILWPIVVLLIVFGAFFLKPWQSTSKETVTVTADGKSQTAPDIAAITATVESTNPNVDLARQETDKKISTIIEQLKSLGIEEKDIKTQNISAGQTYDAPEIMIYPPRKPNTNQYSVSLEVKIRDFTKSDETLASLTQNGATNLYGPSLTLSDEKREEAKSKARENAVESARKKASELAKASGRDLGKVTNITEMGDFGYPVPMVARGEADLQQKASTIQPGQDEVTINLQVEFELD